MPIGRIAHIVADRGFGFITADAPPFERTFFHFSETNKAGIGSPEVGMAFGYCVGPDERTGRPRAFDLEYLPTAEL
jgi:cold shock CspA family protein|tara:strand:+ start:13537 stop:13764 length:228 start_codon:yes stop_codon:yes gene_type:complete